MKFRRSGALAGAGVATLVLLATSALTTLGLSSAAGATTTTPTTVFYLDLGASVSVGIHQGEPVLDLDYSEDSNAGTDMNFVMDDAGGFIEIQGTAEAKTFTLDEMLTMTKLAQAGIRELIAHQKQALGI